MYMFSVALPEAEWLKADAIPTVSERPSGILFTKFAFSGFCSRSKHLALVKGNIKQFIQCFSLKTKRKAYEKREV